MAYYSDKELKKLGFKKLGADVKISKLTSIYGANNIEIGDNSRIDDFCILSAGIGGIYIGRYVHIAAYCSLIGKNRIQLDDFSGLSSKVAIYSSSDDYSGEFMTNPTVPSKYTNVNHGDVILHKHTIVGVGSSILPNVTVMEGTAIGAYSLVVKSCDEYSIYSGVPTKRLKSRKKSLLLLEKELSNE